MPMVGSLFEDCEGRCQLTDNSFSHAQVISSSQALLWTVDRRRTTTYYLLFTIYHGPSTMDHLSLHQIHKRNAEIFRNNFPVAHTISIVGREKFF